MAETLLNDLNPEQRRAVEYLDGPLLVLAGAGSGKTRVLTYKIGYLLDRGDVRPWEILSVTFTNKAAGEMRHRVERLINAPADGMWIGTFHSLCARILRIEATHIGYDSNFSIYDVDDQIRLIQQVMAGLNISKDTVKPRAVQYKISDCKNKMRGPEWFEQHAGNYAERTMAKIFREYETALRRNHAFDFDDLLIKPLDIFTREPAILEKYQQKFRYILVDEYQDTNKAQYYFVKQLSARHRRICVVGDEDQSIYRWRGADIENILSFERDYPECEVVRLEQNYRSTQVILDAANAVVANNELRLGKNLWSSKAGGEDVTVIEAGDEAAEAAMVVQIVKKTLREYQLGYNDIAVLYRTNAQSRALEDKLRRANVPYVIVGGVKFFDRKEVKDVLAYLRILVNPNDTVALRRIINFPTRGIGMKTQERLEAFALRQGIRMYDAMLNLDECEEISGGAKGKIQAFIDSVEAIKTRLEVASAFEIAKEVVDTFRLARMYELSELPEEQVRLENVNELLNSIAAFSEGADLAEATLAKYLEDVALLADIDRWDPTNAAVTLMTLHSAKGLEFPAVIITGLEEGLFPLFRSMEKKEDLEEERRLFYVGMTRAKDHLYLAWARQRRRFSGNNSGMFFRSMPSSFLAEIPREYKKKAKSSVRESSSYRQPGRQEQRRYGRSTAASVASRMVDAGGAYRIGDWVIHEKFGKGQVLGVEGSGNGTKLTVLFAGKQLKKLIAEYANLRKADGST